jgi:3-hydroxyisobutyrate dehydrogenase-like beta-hydroxyacid dehydrogenase
MNETIGFIGVGLMGHGMARNIVEKGYRLTILGHRNRAPVEDLAAEVEANVRGPDGLAAGGKAGLVIIDCSTTDPTSTLALHEELKPKGLTLIDAPLGGTPAQAEEGKLSAMVGADDATFARVRPVIEAWAQAVRHIGPVGDGHKMKLLNNFVAMGYGAIYAEALALARKSGITPQTFDSVLRGSRMDCGFYQTFFKYVLEGDRNAHQFTLKNALKDVRYLESLANKAGVANPVGNAVKNVYASAVNAGREQDYVPMLSDAVAMANGLR